MVVKIDKNELFGILSDWNFWKSDLPSGFSRPAYLEKLDAFLMTRQVVVISGARRAGKSILMRQAAKRLMAADVPRENILFVNFEDPRLPLLDAPSLDLIFDAYREWMNPHGEMTVFLDEIQEVRDWEKWVRTTHELQKARVVLSGSNAHLLSRELGTLLTGRHLDLTVFPLSFPEYLLFKGGPVPRALEAIARKVEILTHLRGYLEWGGFPEVVRSEQKKELLLAYFEDLVNKDLVRRFRIRKAQELRTLAKFYLSHAGSLTTFTSTEKFLQISADTIEKFSGYLEQAYLVFFLKRFSFKMKEQEKSPRKVFAIDPGLSNAVGFRVSGQRGHAAENAVFLELRRRQALEPDLDLYYWKDPQHREVDFVIKRGSAIEQLIQVCWSLSEPQMREREFRSLTKAMDELACGNALVITEDEEGRVEIKGKSVSIVPLWKWLLRLSPADTASAS